MPDHLAISSRNARCLAAAFSVVIALAGCAPTQAPETAQAAVVPARLDMQESPICRPDPALLTPQSAPDCKFGRPDLKTVDPIQWARLKVEFERQCYQTAEKAVRERLRLLQASARCETGTGRR
jgi:hypothetical protein